MVTFDDIFTSAFLDRMGAVPLIDAIVAMLLACGIGLFIFLIYRKTSSAVRYWQPRVQLLRTPSLMPAYTY